MGGRRPQRIRTSRYYIKYYIILYYIFMYVVCMLEKAEHKVKHASNFLSVDFDPI